MRVRPRKIGRYWYQGLLSAGRVIASMIACWYSARSRTPRTCSGSRPYSATTRSTKAAEPGCGSAAAGPDNAASTSRTRNGDITNLGIRNSIENAPQRADHERKTTDDAEDSIEASLTS